VSIKEVSLELPVLKPLPATASEMGNIGAGGAAVMVIFIGLLTFDNFLGCMRLGSLLSDVSFPSWESC